MIIHFIIIIIIIIIMLMYPINKSSNVTQNIKIYTLKSHVIPHKSCANVLVLEQINRVNSQNSKILSSDHVFKILSSLMKSNHNFFRSTEILRQHEYAIFFFFFQKWDKVCVNVSPIPPNFNYTLSPMCKYHGKS